MNGLKHEQQTSFPEQSKGAAGIQINLIIIIIYVGVTRDCRAQPPHPMSANPRSRI